MTVSSTAFLPLPSPPQFSVFQRGCKAKTVPFTRSSVPLFCTSSSESTTILDPDDTISPTRGCKACGREELERGCNGEGRIQGGIATVPGFGWWPIKAYRPCPGLVASGGRYKRFGQSMDEVGFGGGDLGIPIESKDKA